MNKPININSEGEELNLKAQKYRIYLTGGRGINLGAFSILLKNKSTGEIIKCNKTTFPVQTFAFRKRAKRIFVVDIKESGDYEVIFKDTKTIKVKKSNLIIDSIFARTLSIEELDILIIKNWDFYHL